MDDVNDTTDAQWAQQELEERRAREASLAYWKFMFESEHEPKGCEQMDITQFVEGKSATLKASDLKGHEVRVSIAGVEVMEFNNESGKEKKLALSFAGKEKKLVLNKTNAGRIADAYGNDSDGWTGQTIVLYEEKVEFGGNLVPAIRVRVPKPEVSEDEIPW
jgi:hypothetical protein